MEFMPGSMSLLVMAMNAAPSAICGSAAAARFLAPESATDVCIREVSFGSTFRAAEWMHESMVPYFSVTDRTASRTAFSSVMSQATSYSPPPLRESVTTRQCALPSIDAISFPIKPAPPAMMASFFLSTLLISLQYACENDSGRDDIFFSFYIDSYLHKLERVGFSRKRSRYHDRIFDEHRFLEFQCFFNEQTIFARHLHPDQLR